MYIELDCPKNNRMILGWCYINICSCFRCRCTL